MGGPGTASPPSFSVATLSWCSGHLVAGVSDDASDLELGGEASQLLEADTGPFEERPGQLRQRPRHPGRPGTHRTRRLPRHREHRGPLLGALPHAGATRGKALFPPRLEAGRTRVRNRRDAGSDRDPGGRGVSCLDLHADRAGLLRPANGVAFLPFAVAITVGTIVARHLLAHLSPRAVATSGLVLVAVAAGLVAAAPANSRYAVELLPGLLSLGLGVGMVFAPVSVSSMAGIPASHAGVASGSLMTGCEIGAALGVAVLSAVASTAGSLATQGRRRRRLCARVRRGPLAWRHCSPW